MEAVDRREQAILLIVQQGIFHFTQILLQVLLENRALNLNRVVMTPVARSIASIAAASLCRFS